MAFGTRCIVVVQTSLDSEPETFVQRLPNVFQTSMAFGTRWDVVFQTSLVHWVLTHFMTTGASFRTNGEWILTGTGTEFHHLADTVDGVTHYFPQLDFILYIRRRPAYYILNRILPVVLSSFLVVIVFLLPADSGEKVSYALTELLALAFLLTLITDYMPSTSLTVSILGKFLTRI